MNVNENSGHDAPDAHGTIDISETMAAALIDEGMHFATCDDVAVHVEGTQLSTTVKDLTDLGVDHVVADAPHCESGDVIATLGLETSPDPTAEFLAMLENHDHMFDGKDNVGLNVSQAEVDAYWAATPEVQEAIIEKLVDLGIDYVKVIGTHTDYDLPDHSHC